MYRTLSLFLVLAFCSLQIGCSNSDEATGIARTLSARCSLDSECKGALVCVFQHCHEECESSKDCDEGANCVRSEDNDALRVCQFDSQAECVRNSDCENSQICAEDGACRDECKRDKDCADDQICTVDALICADQVDVDQAGQLIVFNTSVYVTEFYSEAVTEAAAEVQNEKLEVSISVPEGSLKDPIQLGVGEASDDDENVPALPKGVRRRSPTFSFLPHGTRFDEAVTITLPHDGEATNELVALHAAPDGEWQELDTEESDDVDRVSFETLSFSYFIVVEKTNAPDSDADAGTDNTGDDTADDANADAERDDDDYATPEDWLNEAVTASILVPATPENWVPDEEDSTVPSAATIVPAAEGFPGAAVQIDVPFDDFDQSLAFVWQFESIDVRGATLTIPINVLDSGETSGECPNGFSIHTQSGDDWAWAGRWEDIPAQSGWTTFLVELDALPDAEDVTSDFSALRAFGFDIRTGGCVDEGERLGPPHAASFLIGDIGCIDADGEPCALSSTPTDSANVDSTEPEEELPALLDPERAAACAETEGMLLLEARMGGFVRADVAGDGISYGCLVEESAKSLCFSGLLADHEDAWGVWFDLRFSFNSYYGEDLAASNITGYRFRLDGSQGGPEDPEYFAWMPNMTTGSTADYANNLFATRSTETADELTVVQFSNLRQDSDSQLDINGDGRVDGNIPFDASSVWSVRFNVRGVEGEAPFDLCLRDFDWIDAGGAVVNINRDAFVDLAPTERAAACEWKDDTIFLAEGFAGLDRVRLDTDEASTICGIEESPGRVCAFGIQAGVSGGEGRMHFEPPRVADGVDLVALGVVGYRFQLDGATGAPLLMGNAHIIDAEDNWQSFYPLDFQALYPDGIHTVLFADLQPTPWDEYQGPFEPVLGLTAYIMIDGNPGPDVPFDFCVSEFEWIDADGAAVDILAPLAE